MRFAKPLYYGNVDGLVYIMMFKPGNGIRMTDSPSGGGTNKGFNTCNPAWDWQFIVPEYEGRRNIAIKPGWCCDHIVHEMRYCQSTKSGLVKSCIYKRLINDQAFGY